MFFIAFMSNSGTIRNLSSIKGIKYFFYYTSLFSYSIYLIHNEIYSIIIKSEYGSAGWAFEVITSSALIYFIAFILFKFFEHPILKFRDRIFI